MQIILNYNQKVVKITRNNVKYIENAQNRVVFTLCLTRIRNELGTNFCRQVNLFLIIRHSAYVRVIVPNLYLFKNSP